MAQANDATVAPRGELEPRERVDRDGVGLDPPHVAEDDGRVARREPRADTVGETGEVAPRDRPVDGELERARRFGGHRTFDRPGARDSSVPGR